MTIRGVFLLSALVLSGFLLGAWSAHADALAKGDEPGSIAVTVEDLCSVLPYHVWIESAGHLLIVTSTNLGGELFVQDLTPGSYVVTAYVNGEEVPKTVLVISGEITEADFELTDASVFGRVVDSKTGQPLAGATVLPSGGSSVVTGTACGGFELFGVSSSGLTLEVTRSGYTGASVNLKSGAAKGLRVSNIELKPDTLVGTRLHGRVYTEEVLPGPTKVDAPVRGARVSVSDPLAYGGMAQITVWTTAQGFYDIVGLANGEHSVEVDAEGYQGISETPILGCNELRNEDYELFPASGGPGGNEVDPSELDIFGSVFDIDAFLPIEGASVRAGGHTVLTDSEGRYSFRNSGFDLPVGFPEVSVEAEGYYSESHFIALDSGPVQFDIELVLAPEPEGEGEGGGPCGARYTASASDPSGSLGVMGDALVIFCAALGLLVCKHRHDRSVAVSGRK